MPFNKQKKKYMTVQYKNQKFEVQEFNNEFTGYEVIKERDKISYIKEYMYGEEIGSISFRPTKEPLIFSISYGHYNEERYSNNSICVRCSQDNGRISGEYVKYDINGNIQEIRYYSEGTDVTEEIKSFIGYTGSKESFYQYKFQEDEMFNILLKYGSSFRMLDDFNIDSTEFDRILKGCLK